MWEILINLTRSDMLFASKKSVFRCILRKSENNRLRLLMSRLILSCPWNNLRLIFVELLSLPFKINLTETTNAWCSVAKTKRWSLIRCSWGSWGTIWVWRKFAVHGLVASVLLEWWEPDLWLRWILLLTHFLSNDWSNVWLSFVPLDILLIIFWAIWLCSSKEVVFLDFVLVGKVSHRPLLERILINWFVHFAIIFYLF